MNKEAKNIEIKNLLERLSQRGDRLSIDALSIINKKNSEEILNSIRKKIKIKNSLYKKRQYYKLYDSKRSNKSIIK